MSKDVSPCKVENRHLKPCWILKERLGDSSGIVIMPIISITTLGTTRTLLVHKKNARDKGLCINFCPFCGENLGGLTETKFGRLPE